MYKFLDMQRTKKTAVKCPRSNQGVLKSGSTLQQILKVCQEINSNISALKSSCLHTKQLLTLSEFCEYAGISKSYAYYLTGNNLINYFKPKGKLIYVDRETAEAFIRQNEVKALTELKTLSNNYIVNHKK